MYKLGQKQLDDLHLAPCRHLCRWRGDTHITGYSDLKPLVIMQRWSEEHRAFAVETFFKNSDSATVIQCASIVKSLFEVLGVKCKAIERR
jgi:hypothetical protein